MVAILLIIFEIFWNSRYKLNNHTQVQTIHRVLVSVLLPYLKLYEAGKKKFTHLSIEEIGILLNLFLEFNAANYFGANRIGK